MIKDIPFVSIIIPCRNEEKFIGKCLDSIIKNDYPKEKLEIIVVDGASTDKTKEAVGEYIKKYDFIRLLDNPQKTTPISMNIGIKASNGEILSKTDTHSEYPANYISKIVDCIEKYGADIAGGVALAVPKKDTYTAKGIVMALRSKLGSGGSAFRTTEDGEPRPADTAFGILFRKSVINKIGLFNEKLTRSQDTDFAIKAEKARLKIYLVPEVRIKYYPKADLTSFFRHTVKDGLWVILPLKYGSSLFKIRHLVPLAFVLGIILLTISGFLWKPFWFLLMTLMALYLIILFIGSVKIAVKEKQSLLTFHIMAALVTRHIAYGIGSMIGLVRLVLPEK